MGKIWKAVAIIDCVILGFFFIWTLTVREENKYFSTVESFVETGTCVELENGQFKYNGNVYKDISLWEPFYSDVFNYYVEFQREGKPIMDIKDKCSLWESLMNDWHKNNGYLAKSAIDVSLICVSDSSDTIYGREEELSKVEEYYGDYNNYRWTLSDDSLELEETLELSKEELQWLSNLNESTAKVEIRESNAKQYILYKQSQDKVFTAGTELRKVGEHWYWYNTHSDKDGYFIGAELPSSFNDKLNKIDIKGAVYD